MYTIKHAEYRGMVKQGGEQYAQVAVQSLLSGQPEVLAHFVSDGRGGYDMPLLLESHADLDIDWYENNLHQAFVDITDPQGTSRSFAADPKAREQFKKEVLSYGDIREKLQNALGDIK
ncbi:hypothetical protein [Paenibacillus gansuensis]|uniref:Uncharacterized protein n=1 Tax=Paenibacillus gansuensis TaxID=306542 RepID=A0ABW5PC44_9BACL